MQSKSNRLSIPKENWFPFTLILNKTEAVDDPERVKKKTVGVSITHLDQGWTMRGWMIVSRWRARGRPRAPGRNGTASGGENPGLVAEQHFPDFLRTLADHRPPSVPLYRATRSRDPRSTSNVLFSRSLTQSMTCSCPRLTLTQAWRRCN